MKKNSNNLAEQITRLLPSANTLPVEKQVKLLWTLVGTLMADMQTLQVFHDAIVSGFVAYGQSGESIEADQRQLKEVATKVLQSVIQEI